MSRKPAIFLCVLLFLSLGGAVAHYLFRNDKHPTFTEVDAFMRAFPVPNGWQLSGLGADVPFYLYKEKDWRYRFGIWKKIRYEHELYIYLVAMTSSERMNTTNRRRDFPFRRHR